MTGRVVHTRQEINSDDPGERGHLKDLEADGRILTL
jgi:hypothetical protein